MDPFRYIPPTDETAPKYAAIRAATDETAREISTLLQIDRVTGAHAWQGDHPGHSTKSDAFDAINRVTRALYLAIQEHAPASADRSAAERCVRLARMAANEAIAAENKPGSIASRIALEQLYLARWQACAAIALASTDGGR